MRELIQSDFLTPMSEIYGAHPPTLAPNLAARCKPLTAEQLRAAAERVIRTRKARGFPSFSECLLALSLANMAQPHSSASPLSQRNREIIAETKRRLALAKIRRDEHLALRASEGGWLVALIDFVTDDDRFPTEREIEKLAATSKTNDGKCYARDGSPLLDGKLLRLRAEMKASAHREIFGRALA